MRAYDRDDYQDLDEYGNLDEYEEDGDELEEEEAGEEEYEEEEQVHQPTQEELEYLGLRERLKEAIRKKMKKESGSAHSSSLNKKNLPTKDNFGSFFGPSQPVIAQRVIQESKSLLENPDLATRVFKSKNAKNKSSASTPVRSNPQANGSAPKVTNGVKTKVQMLKNTRDYSFLLTDDAELPAPAKDHIPRNVSAPHSGVFLLRLRIVSPCKCNIVFSFRKLIQVFDDVEDAQSAKMQQRIREPLSNSGRKVPDGREERKVRPLVYQAQAKMGTQKLATLSKPKQTLIDPKRQIPSNKGIGPGRPSVEKAVPSNNPVGTLQKKVPLPGAKIAKLPVQKPPPPKSQPVSKQPLVQKRELQESYKAKVLQKQPVSSSKTQVKQPPPRNPSRVDERTKRKPIRRDEPRRGFEDDDDDVNAISMIRQMFGYNPNRYKDDDDDSDMEANFDQIQREERRSLKIGQREDEIALREIEEEERRERLRKEAKKRKVSQR